MGDCRLFFRIEPSFFGLSDERDQPVIFSKVFSADTTVREVCDGTTLNEAKEYNSRHDDKETVPSLRSLMRDEHKARLWDCTLHPPIDITDWPLHTFSAIKGSKSKTLYDAGWFPSGTLYLSSPNQAPKLSSVDLDTQYNLQQNVGENRFQSKGEQIAEGAALLHGHGHGPNDARQKPSQLLQAAKNRFAAEDEEDSTLATQDTASASVIETSKTQRILRQRREANRKRHLEDCLKKLDHSKNGNVSAQVRRMLIKSRAIGKSTLAVRDRVYFHCIFLDESKALANDHEPRQEFCYWSRQDTVGRVQDSFQIPKPCELELLIRISGGEDSENADYAKLPSLMRLYEAIDNGYISEADNKVVLRIYNPEHDNPTIVVDHSIGQALKSDPDELKEPPESVSQDAPPSIAQQQPDGDKIDSLSSREDPPDTGGLKLVAKEVVPTTEDPDLLAAASCDTAESSKTTASAQSTKSDPSGSKKHVESEDMELSTSSPMVVSPRLVQAIRNAEQGSSKRKTKSKASAAARKVRQMQIKSKAIGDDKRVRSTNRFHFEVALVVQNPVSNNFDVTSIQPHYLAIDDKLSRIVRDHYSSFSYHVQGIEQKVDRWDYLILSGSSDEAVHDVTLQRILEPDQSLKDLHVQALIEPFDKVILMPLLGK